nr:Chain C, Pre-mRNA-processing factor 19 [Mus musculus]
KYLQVASHV